MHFSQHFSPRTHLVPSHLFLHSTPQFSQPHSHDFLKQPEAKSMATSNMNLMLYLVFKCHFVLIAREAKEAPRAKPAIVVLKSAQIYCVELTSILNPNLSFFLGLVLLGL